MCNSDSLARSISRYQHMLHQHVHGMSCMQSAGNNNMLAVSKASSLGDLRATRFAALVGCVMALQVASVAASVWPPGSIVMIRGGKDLVVRFCSESSTCRVFSRTARCCECNRPSGHDRYRATQDLVCFASSLRRHLLRTGLLNEGQAAAGIRRPAGG